jgi:plastocyanin
VAIVDATHALIVDSLNHVVRLQVAGGGGEVVFGVACEHGDDERHLLNPRGAAIDELGNVFISDTANGRVVLLAAATGSDVARTVSVPAPATATAPAAEEEEEVQPASTPVATGAAFEVGVPDACPPDEPRCAAADRFVPDAIAVAPGESVTFNINGVSHQVAVYGPGVRPADLDTTLVGGVADTPGDGRTIIDPSGRIAESPDLPFAPDPATRWEWDTTGVAAGTYLVICTFQPHFAVGMYGWVIVE